jgi:hypothetical protein
MMIPKVKAHRTYWGVKCEGCDQHPMMTFAGCNWMVFRCLCEDKNGVAKAHRKHMDMYWPMKKYTFKVYEKED